MDSSAVNSTRCPFAQQLEHRLAYGAAMKKVLDTALISNEAEALVDEQTSDCAGRHSRVPPMLRQKLGQCREDAVCEVKHARSR